MSKNVRLLLLLFVAGIPVAYGVIAYRFDLPPFRLDAELSRVRSPGPGVGSGSKRRGRWNVSPDTAAAARTVPEREAMERLRSIGYLSGSEPAPAWAGVTRYEPDSAYAGYNLAVSGHAPEAWLFDMHGRVLHRWRKGYLEVFPDAPIPGETETPFYWRRVHCFANGDLLAVFEGLGLVKLDRDSRVLWALPRPVHHDVRVTADGTIYTLIRELRMLPQIDPREPVLEDYVAVIDEDGRVLRTISLLQAFLRSPYRAILDRMPAAGDLFHTNTVELMDGSLEALSPLYRRGNALISLLAVDAIGIVDLAREEVVWAATGSWKAQHQPTLLENGDILLLDNRGWGGRSRAMEMDPRTGKVTWTYGETPATAFATYDCGSVARLPNGNTLITESARGRAFEITRSGRVVWEYYNPTRAGERQELIATLFEVVRIPARDFGPWLEAPGDKVVR